MTQSSWNELSLFAQFSNIHGDVERLIRTHEKFLRRESSKDNSLFYLDNIIKLIKMTLFDSKNSARGYMAIELYDEVEEIRAYLRGERTAEYILRYWKAYTNALGKK